jgi:hypothetical protein
MADSTKPVRGPYRTFLRNLRRYFTDYGGWRGFALSPFLHIGIFVSAVSYPIWMTGKWVDSVTSIIPSLLGFSLGTYALLFSLMSNRMKQALRHLRNRGGIPYLDEINATFFHFILVQTICLSWAILMRSSIVYDLAVHFSVSQCVMDVISAGNSVAGFLGYTLLSYSVLLVIASSLAVYRLARLVDPSAS